MGRPFVAHLTSSQVVSKKGLTSLFSGKRQLTSRFETSAELSQAGTQSNLTS
jgi:hypothetical protein